MNITRRRFIRSAAATASASALATSALATRTAAASSGHPLKAIVTGGHPGDPEYGCGGTISRLTGLGHEVVLLYLNNGSSPDSPNSPRIAEAKKACEILKARPLFAGQEDGHAILDNAHYDAYARLLTAEKPDLVFTQWPIDNHRDHRAISTLTFDAWKNSNRSFALYYYEVSDGEDTLQFSPTLYIDITNAEPAKRAACYAHASQTPDRYYKMQDEVALFRGTESGVKRAEAFLSQLRNPSDPLQTLLPR